MSDSDKDMVDSSGEMIKNIDDITPCRATLEQVVCKTLRKESQWADVPVYLQDNREMVLDAIRFGTVNWYELPPKWRNDVEVTCASFEEHRLILIRCRSHYYYYGYHRRQSSSLWPWLRACTRGNAKFIRPN
jgi:hypothetical protein